MNRADRDRYFDRNSRYVTLRLEGQTVDISVNTGKASFWNGICGELLSKEIGLWLINNGVARG